MTSSFSRRILAATLLSLGLLFFKSTSVAQEITYYDFDAPQASNGSSLSCVNPATIPGPLPAPNPLFCFNNGGGTNPGFLSATYPAIVDPVTTDVPPVPSTHFDVQLTVPATNEAASVWFSVPQKISNGFTSYFAFRMTPDQTQSSPATADGIAFVIQNAAGGITGNSCVETGSGPNAVGGQGGCIGYGGLDNSLALEFDTFKNAYDPTDINASTYNHSSSYNDNHIALQNCGAGLANSPDHTGSCLVQLLVNNALQGAINSQLPLTLADGNVHQVVVQYSGPTEATPNLLQIFIDPAFVPETHTPTANAVPVISGIYNIPANLNLMNSGSANDSAYVGFTSATGAAFEQHELLVWTFTPHTPVTQQQPLSPPGTPTIFPFGAHTYTVTYPVGGPGTTGIDMVVTANTITPTLFSQLIANTGFAGSICQTYDETGGNCVVYSTSCVTHGTTTVVQCPASTDPSQLINVKSAYNNTIQPVSPGFIQGDPFYSPITSITVSGTTATVTCLGECSVTTGQAVTVAGNLNGSSPSGFNGNVTVLFADPTVPNVFTFTTTASGTGTGGYLTSNNVQNIFTSYVPQRIDGSTAGKTKNFSDLVVTSVTNAVTSIAITAPTVAYGTSASVGVTVSSVAGAPTGTVSLTVDGGAPITQALSGGPATFSIPGLLPGVHNLVASFSPAALTIFQGSSTTATLTVTGPVALVSPASINFGTVYLGTLSIKSVTLTNIGSAPMTITEKLLAIVGGGNSNEFVDLSLCPSTLNVGKSCTILVSFIGGPTYNTVQTATLMINDSAPGSPQPVPLTANVINPQASFSPSALNFGTQTAHSTSQLPLTLTNSGNTLLTITNFGIGGANASDFTANTTGCPASLAAKTSCTITVSFVPGSTGNRSATLTVRDNVWNGSQQVSLSGKGK
jgi:hypothetical protein